MTTLLKTGMQVLLPSGNVVRVLSVVDDEATCAFVFPSISKGEITFTVRWLARFCVALSVR